MMVLYSGTTCPFSHRCRFVLFEKGMDFEIRDVDLFNKPDDIAVMNPYGQVPILVERDLIIGSGLAVVDGYYVEGLLMESSQHSVDILAAKQALDGSHDRITTSYGAGAKFELSPGDYIARVSEGGASAETPFTVKAGERVNVSVILQAGVLAVSAPGASEITVFKAKADINGNRKRNPAQLVQFRQKPNVLFV